MEWSAYQDDIFEFFKYELENLLCNAVAGAGKSVTADEIARRSRYSTVYCAFNKDIVTERKPLIGNNADCKTINGIGHGALIKHFEGNIKLEDGKYKDLVYEATETVDPLKRADVRDSLNRLVSFAQSSLTSADDHDALAALVDHYDIDLPIVDVGMSMTSEDWYFNVTESVLNAGEEIARRDNVISFNDQIWLPNLWDLKPKRYEVVIGDEIQDWSKGKTALVMRTVDVGGRLIGFGDPHQSIYGFAGADPRAWGEILKATGAKELPLSVCYRCPTSHIELASQIVPHIQAAPNAIPGVLDYLSESQIAGMVQSGDLILSRFAAPLLRLCLHLISMSIPARVAGRDIVKSLLALAREAAQLGSWEDFPKLLDQVVGEKTIALQAQKNSASRIESLLDRKMGLLACHEAIHAPNFQSFAKTLDGLFSDQKTAVTLSTVHRAKGLGRDRVFILDYPSLGMARRDAAPWQIEQEQNLKYVALTRSKRELYLVS